MIPRRIGLTMRVVEAVSYAEPRDCLAQDWPAFLQCVGPALQWMFLPNLGSEIGDYYRRWNLEGVILTGGNDVGTCPSRDRTEQSLLEMAVSTRTPVLGVCRGMQMMQQFFGGSLAACSSEGHVSTRHRIRFTSGTDWVAAGTETDVNSYHESGIAAGSLASQLNEVACSSDGWVEACRHRSLPIVGVQWHPEREGADRSIDLAMISSLFELER